MVCLPSPVVVPPGKPLSHQLLALEALHELENMQVWDINLGMLLKVEVLLGLQDALCNRRRREDMHIKIWIG
jgi:hypothetical protein